MRPYPKTEQTHRKRPPVDWSGFSCPKGGKVELKGAAYTRLKARVHKRDGYRCVVCFRADSLTLGHAITKRSKCRKDTEENTVCECVFCNDAQETGLLKVEYELKGRRPVVVQRWRRTNPEHSWKRVTY